MTVVTRPTDGLDLGLRRLRAIGALALPIVVIATRDDHRSAGTGELVATIIVAVALFASNITVARVDRPAAWRGWTGIVIAQIVIDLLAALAALSITGATLSNLATLIFLVPILESGVRFRVIGALSCWLAMLGLLGARETLTTNQPIDIAAFTQIELVVLFVGLPVAYLAEHLAADLLRTARARAIAERRAELLGGLALAARDLNALEQPGISDALARAVTSFGATNVAVHINEGTAWRRVDNTETADDQLLTGRFEIGVHPVGEPIFGRVRFRLGVQAETEQLLVHAEVGRDYARLVFEALEILGRQATVALTNSALHRQLERLNAESIYRAEHDPLTGLTNRAGLDKELGAAFASSPRQTVAALYVDLDAFKPINDRHGHDIGDRVLITLSRRFQAVVGQKGTVCRVGGDEFLVLYRGDTAARDASTDRPALTEAAAKPIMLDELSFPFEVVLGASVGIATANPHDDSTQDTLLTRADESMYQTKSQRRRSLSPPTPSTAIPGLESPRVVSLARGVSSA
jgi:diguanylate cyclase (GGDEF)-like protein